MEDRQKVLYVSKKMKEKRQETLERITSDYGTQLRMNRSIQAEGSFANIKEDMEFRSVFLLQTAADDPATVRPSQRAQGSAVWWPFPSTQRLCGETAPL